MILALRALGVGDLATAVPALRGLRAAFPGQSLALAAPGWLAPLVRLVGGVDELLPTEGLGPRRWPPLAPQWAVNLHGRGPESHRLLRSAGPAALCAFACPAAGHVQGPQWAEDEHEVWRWCRMLRWYGVACDPDDLGLARPAPAGAPVGVTVVHPGAKTAERRWPPERFAAVAGTLAARGHRVVVTGSASEIGTAAEVARRAGLPRSAVLAGAGGLRTLAAVVAHARMVVSGDTGVAHLATGYGTPSVVLFGSVSPRRWGPPPDRPQHRVLWHEDLAGQPQAGAPHPCLLAVSVEEVLAAASAVAPDARACRAGRRGRSRV